jgi:hypothetical protein
MAVIAMYAEQVERLRQALGRRRFKRPVKIDTVDSFEGREEDLVVISLVRSNERGRIGFLRVPNRLNVAISRAKRLVACIGDSATLRSGEESMYGELVEAARAGGGWVSAAELVTPLKKKGVQRKGLRPAAIGPDGEPIEVVEGAEPATRKRRRRRRKRTGLGATGAVAVPQVGPDGEPIAAPQGGQPTVGEPGTGEGRKRRRRRRRRSGRGGEAGPPGVAAPAAEAGDAEAGGGQPGEVPSGSRSRRRRRRSRSGGSGGPVGGEQTALALESGPSQGDSVPAA